MKGIVLHCPNYKCQKLLGKDAFLPYGTELKLKCYYCGHFVQILSERKGIKLSDFSSENLTEEKKCDIIFLET